MIDPAFKLKWIDALRSDKYRQARNMLRGRDGSGYCCMGVALDLIDPGLWKNKSNGFSWEGESHICSPGDVKGVSQELGIDVTVAHTLADMNDGRRVKNDGPHHLKGDGVSPKSFAEIADWIEKNL